MKYKDFKKIDPYSDPWDRANEYFIKTQTTPKWKKKLAVFFAIVGVFLCLSGLYFVASHIFVEVPYLKGRSFEEVSDVCDDLNLKNVTYKAVWNDNVEKDTVIKQNRFGWATIWSPIQFEMSMGLNPEEIIMLNLKGRTQEDIEKTLDELHYTDYTFKKAVSYNTPEGEAIGQSVSFRRNEKIIIYISVGKENIGVEISMPNLVGWTKSQVDAWASKNNIRINYTQEMSTYDTDVIFNQNITAGTTILTGSSVNVKISKGKGWVVPDYKTLQEYKTWASGKNIKVTFNETYSDDVPSGTITYISLKPGSVIREGGSITISGSIGSVKVPNLESIEQIKEAINEINKKVPAGKEIKLEFVKKESSEPLNSIIGSSAKTGETIKLGSTLKITVAQPKKNLVKSQHDITVEELEEYLAKLGMNLGRETKVDSDLEAGKVVSNVEGNFAIGSDIDYQIAR